MCPCACHDLPPDTRRAPGACGLCYLNHTPRRDATMPGRYFDSADTYNHLSAQDRADLDQLARDCCAICGAPLLLDEAGPHFRTIHPNDRPRTMPTPAGYKYDRASHSWKLAR
jgi:hypothetical protein